ncbi:3-phosphoshikimate 1-carboxyvinyltransferase [Robertkochia solimangrovi]|uniref:3-phosphoshikimate 1-carboxyvinyltransferase n=1 Tax=Robertkochia solimangrovi TaxID=2213046 RepID=UPI00117C3DC1|nr:3-phosphoshikimate 1-carboxyvinyltransferase [Robertkochia solimangrovi]TRZ44377.1 3-phosphoshikimate 1-carboxyvinyltransferase [Robertkochia solimangrovi]
MKLRLTANNRQLKSAINITGSKSESNRLLLLRALYPDLEIANLSNSDDSRVMSKGVMTDKGTVDIHHAGTAMRFLTAFFACSPGKEVVLTGSQRMTERPISILVDALRQLGADISYVAEEGFPPLKIKGRSLEKNKVVMAANVSSQYISALLLIAPGLENGLELHLEGKITSVPYIKMTLALLNEIGITTSFEGSVINIQPKSAVDAKVLTVESDWSSASYFYSIAALAESAHIDLSSYKQNSLQGDSVLQDLYVPMGVNSEFNDHTVVLTSGNISDVQKVVYDLSDAPDIAQTIAVTCFGLGIGCELTGLHTLKIKETDRLEALKTELGKLGAQIEVTDKSLHLEAGGRINRDIAIDTYNDHRMAMAFAPLAMKVPIIINDAEVVSKSYPDFWNDMKSIGFEVETLD